MNLRRSLSQIHRSALKRKRKRITVQPVWVPRNSVLLGPLPQREHDFTGWGHWAGNELASPVGPFTFPGGSQLQSHPHSKGYSFKARNIKQTNKSRKNSRTSLWYPRLLARAKPKPFWLKPSAISPTSGKKCFASFNQEKQIRSQSQDGLHYQYPCPSLRTLCGCL